MVKASELRIGNWIIAVAKMGNYHMKMTKHNFEASPESVIPIALTPEILEGCAFKKSLANGTYYLSVGDIELVYDDGLKLSLSGSRQPLPIKYLHQLQNLYFALTGNEIEISFEYSRR